MFGAFNHGIEFFPEDIPPKDVFVDIETPVGTRAAATDAYLRRIEAALREAPGREDWASGVAISGGGGGSAAAGAMGQGGPSGPDKGRTTVSLVDFQDRENDAFAVLAWMQENVRNVTLQPPL